MNKLILKNSFSTTSAFVVTAVVTFFITPIVVHGLGKELYGIWVLVIGLTGYMGLLDFGMRTSIVKYVSEYYGRKDFTRLNTMGSTAITLFVAVGLLCWIVAAALSFFIRDIFNLESAGQINFLHLFIIIGADVFLTFSLMIYQGSLAGFQRYDLSVRNGLAAFAIRSVLIVLLLRLGYGIISISIAVLVANAAGYLMNFKSCKVICPKLSYSVGQFSQDEFHVLWQYSWKSFVTNISDRLVYYSDSIIIGIFLTPEHITIYAIASSLIIYLRQLVLSVAGVLVPAVSSADADGDVQQVQKIVISGSKLILFVLVPVSVVLFILGNDFIRLWMGPGFDESYRILVILLVSQFLVLAQYGVTLVLYGLAKHEILARVNMAVAVSNIILSVILVPYLGLVGVAIGSAVPMCLLRLFFIPRRVFTAIEMKFSYFFSHVIVPLCLVCVLYSIVLLVLKFEIGSENWLRFIITLILSMVAYGMIFYFIGLNRQERNRVWNTLRAGMKHKAGMPVL
ncbi:MAG: polysaccharide biosynthesis protein [Sedimentisphaerales bacterium]|nr:polysaccharide biosynthesis protein [Sedimentisphaerales bacterium]